jgi:pimeloyl-ACP methyl ester carboxylesterase
MSLPVERYAFSRGAGEMVVYRYGAVGARPLLAIHGVTSSHLAFQFLADEWIERGYTVYAPDLRGRGQSNAIGAPYGMATHADDMAAVLDFLGIDAADVAGHSMGAFVALALFGLHPTRVERLMLLDGGLELGLPPGMTIEQVMPLVLGPALERLSTTFASEAAYLDFWKAHPAFTGRWTDEMAHYAVYDLQGTASELHARTAPEAVARDTEDLWGGGVVSAALASLDRDVLMVCAERGLQDEPVPLYPRPWLDVVLQRYPRVSSVTIPDTNHYDLVIGAYGAKQVAAAIDEFYRTK